MFAAASALAACGGGDAQSDDNADTGVNGDGAPNTDAPVVDTAPPSTTCDNPIAVDKSSLVFDGVDDYVTMGVAPTLGLDKFTVEAWVYREGAGVPASTGVGGLSVVPIAGKGRGENDGSNVDCNYTFGFAGSLLAADFEDKATGANHPVQGKTAVSQKQWHHVAVTYDGNAWKLYLDGKLDGEAVANATPRSDSIQHFAIGTTLDSKGVAAGFFRGRIDEVRVWSRARSAAELEGGMFKRVFTGDGLVSRWALDAKDTGAPDSVGKNDGTLTGGLNFVSEGAILDLGTAPSFTTITPNADAVATGTSTVLKVSVTDPDSDKFIARFHVRDLGLQDDFTLVVLPDTQYYTSTTNRLFDDQTDWIMKNRAAYNIVGVIHNGDIVDTGSNDAQWAIADAAMKLLEVKSTDLPHGMPYGTCAGNHDQAPFNTVGATTKYNQYFGPKRFAGRDYFGGTFAPGKADENWVRFDAGGREIVVVNLQFSTKAREAPVMEWTRKVFADHPNALGIVNSHHILGATADFSTVGRSIYDGVKSVDNVQLLTCGHVGGESRRTDKTPEGNVIHSMLADYQFRERGGGGSLRIWEFSPANNELTVRTYSPVDKKFETDGDSEFTLKLDLEKPAGPFNEVASVDPATVGEISTTVSGLLPNHTYEWYVTVDDCVHVASTAPRRFKIAK
jgi:hypothetical protein